MNVLEEVSRITKQLMLEEPFYGLFLITLNKVLRSDIPTAGVAKNGINTQLAINPTFWESLTDVQKKFLLKHEVLHICFMHLFMRNDFQDWEVFNIAADIEINQYINPAWRIEGGCFLDTYPELKLEPNKGTRHYYYEILNAYQKKTCPALTCLIDSMKQGHGEMHGTWKEFDDLSEAEKELVRKQVDYQVKDLVESQKLRGNVPGELKQYIDELFTIHPPIFDWKKYVRRFAGSSDVIYTKKTRYKISKRFPGNPALRIKTRKHILVAVDTSGSVSDKELLEFFSEIHHIYKCGCKVTIAQCDADIHDIREYKGKFDGRIAGRGGTSFQPPIDFFDKNPKYTTLIYLTDGFAPMPTRPKRSQMLWVMSSRSNKLDTFTDWPGFKIKIPNEKT